MPPRKRAAAQPKETPTLEEQQAPPEPTENPGADDGQQVAPADSGGSTDSPNAASDGDDTPTSSDSPDETDPGEQPCTQCWPAGWPDYATSLGCGHGSWNRDL